MEINGDHKTNAHRESEIFYKLDVAFEKIISHDAIQFLIANFTQVSPRLAAAFQNKSGLNLSLSIALKTLLFFSY